MTADELLTQAVDTRLHGDRRRVAELFLDDAFHDQLALAPDLGGPRHYRPQAYDGWYFIHVGAEYQVYRQERQVRTNMIRFARAQDAASHFFRKTGFTAAVIDEGRAGGAGRLAPARALAIVLVVFLVLVVPLLTLPGAWLHSVFPGSGPVGVASALCLCVAVAACRNKRFRALLQPVPIPVRPQDDQGPQEGMGALAPRDPADPSGRFSGPVDDSGMQRCLGFLEAMCLLNDEETDCYATFFLQLLPPGGDLQDALALHFDTWVSEHDAVLHAGRSASDWRIHTEEVALQKAFVARICADWFFQSGHMHTAPHGLYRSRLVGTFLHLLEQVVGACTVHSVSIDPPCWYAIRWDLVVFERGNDRFLLHFSHSN